MHPSLHRVDHRPWPLPGGRWTWRQSWCDLLFAHWPVPAATLRPLVPEALSVQEFDGASWVGVVPFHMRDVMKRGLPALPGISAFAELNLRLYVERDGKPGVWFLSLDATKRLAVWAARRFFHLPYFHAAISVTPDGERFRYRSRRLKSPTPVRFEAAYAPTTEPYESTPGSLEHFLTERYCLYAAWPDGSLYRTDVHHAPWPLQQAEANIRVNELTAPHGFPLDGPPPLLHFARNIDVIIWPSEKVVV